MSIGKIIIMEKSLKESIGQKLKDARVQLGWSQQYVAEQLGVAQPVYQRFEKGVFECSYEQLKKLCQLLDLSADYLLGLCDY